MGGGGGGVAICVEGKGDGTEKKMRGEEGGEREKERAA